MRSRRIASFSPRASERRTLLKIEVCYTSSQVHIFTSSHVHILTYSHLHKLTPSHPLYLHILTSSHLPIRIFTSPHLHIFNTSSLSLSRSSPSDLHIFNLSLSFSLSLSLPPSFFFFSLLRLQAVPTRRHDMATLSHEMRFGCQKLSKTALFLRFYNFRGTPFARNEVRAGVKQFCLRVWWIRRSRRRGSNQKLAVFCDLTSSVATCSHETRFECQELPVCCDLYPRQQPFRTKRARLS